MNRIGVVVVTYNRLEKLKIALQSYEKQSSKPEYILVVDNNSTDGTGEYLREWESQSTCIEHKVLQLEKNMGGSGGFYEGIKAAEALNTEWIWVADDDAYPDEKCFEIFGSYIEKHDMADISALCSSVYTDGKIDTWHRRRFAKRYGFILEERRIKQEEYKQDSFELDLFSYVGTLLKRASVEKAGLPERQFFIAYDDSEHSIRMRKEGKILCLPNAFVVHDTPDAEDEKITWKKYYTLRNKVYSYRRHFGILQAAIQRMYFLMKNRGNTTLYQMTKKAMDDAKSGTLGLDPIYQPGWQGDANVLH